MSKINIIIKFSLDIFLTLYWELLSACPGVPDQVHMNGLNQIVVLVEVHFVSLWVCAGVREYTHWKWLSKVVASTYILPHTKNYRSVGEGGKWRYFIKSVAGMATSAVEVAFFQPFLGLSKNVIELSWKIGFICKTTEIMQIDNMYDIVYACVCVNSVKKAIIKLQTRYFEKFSYLLKGKNRLI